jgi:hypothetical protein
VAFKVLACLPEQVFKELFFQDFTSPDARTLGGGGKTVFLPFSCAQLKRVEPADQRPGRIDPARVTVQENAFLVFQRLLHFVSIGFMTENFNCELFRGLLTDCGNALCFFFE